MAKWDSSAVWNVTGDDARDHWTYTPIMSVGPLRFGMSHDEVVQALGDAHAHATRGGPPLR